MWKCYCTLILPTSVARNVTSPASAGTEESQVMFTVLGPEVTVISPAMGSAHVDVHDEHVIDDAVVEKGTFTGTHDGVLHAPTGDVPLTGPHFSVQVL
jgi:hypothetical protein